MESWFHLVVRVIQEKDRPRIAKTEEIQHWSALKGLLLETGREMQMAALRRHTWEQCDSGDTHSLPNGLLIWLCSEQWGPPRSKPRKRNTCELGSRDSNSESRASSQHVNVGSSRKQPPLQGKKNWNWQITWCNQFCKIVCWEIVGRHGKNLQ